MNLFLCIVQVYIIIWSIMYVTRNVQFFLYTEECKSVDSTHGSAINVQFKLGLSPLHNRVYGDIICKDGSKRRREKQELPVLYCPNTSNGSRTAVMELIDSICKPVPSEEPIELVFDSSVCAICLESTECKDAMDDMGDHVSAQAEQGEPAIPLNCGHCFHQECIRRWRRIQNNCPLCKTEIN